VTTPGFVERPTLIFNFDGAGTPTTPAGWGWVLTREDDPEELASGFGPLPKGTSSNVAEYTALTAAARYASVLDGNAMVAGEVRPMFIFRGDSQLIINQTLGTWRVKTPELGPLRLEVRSILDRLESWTMQWVRREHNRRADELAALGKVQALAQWGES
jgi:ribonuclease HI